MTSRHHTACIVLPYNRQPDGIPDCQRTCNCCLLQLRPCRLSLLLSYPGALLEKVFGGFPRNQGAAEWNGCAEGVELRGIWGLVPLLADEEGLVLESVMRSHSGRRPGQALAKTHFGVFEGHKTLFFALVCWSFEFVDQYFMSHLGATPKFREVFGF